MNLKILEIRTTKDAKIPKGAVPFHWVTHHVKEIYFALLPKMEINGSSKISIEFGPKGDEPVFDNVLGSSNHFIEDFNFEQFYQLSQHQKDLLVLDIIKDSLLVLYKKRGSNKEDIEAIKITAEEVVRAGFELRIAVQKLAKTYKKTYDVTVSRILNSEVGESWRCTIKDKSGILVKEEWMTKVPDYLDRTDYFKKAELKNDTFFVYNQLGKTVYQVLLGS